MTLGRYGSYKSHTNSPFIHKTISRARNRSLKVPWALNDINKARARNIHGKNCEEEEGLKIEVCEEAHNSQKAKVLDTAVQDS